MFEVNLSERAKVALLDILMEKVPEAQGFVKGLMDQALEKFLLAEAEELSVKEPVPAEQELSDPLE